jgi:CO dehydrogenase nickel-insertion accessory protein CooC1
MSIDTHNQTLSGLFRMLGASLRNFARSLNTIIKIHESETPEIEVKELIERIKIKIATNEKEKEENKEMLKVLNQLASDKKVFKLMKIESEEWIEFLDAIEARSEMGKSDLTEEEAEIYDSIKRTAAEIKSSLREK